MSIYGKLLRMKSFISALVTLSFLALFAQDDVERPLPVWRMPSVWLQHSQLRNQLIESIRSGNIPAMEATCRTALEIMPGDATWHYNLACALAYREQPGLALTELDKAITFGFRDAEAISKDNDLERIRQYPRFAELVEKARSLQGKPIDGVPTIQNAFATTGGTVTLTATNVFWNFDVGCFETHLTLAPAKKTISELAANYGLSKPTAPERPYMAAWLSEGTASGNGGDLYVNRDGYHSALKTSDFPHLTSVRFAKEGEAARVHLDHPNTLFPGHAVFGNVSRAIISGPFWRSNGRAALTEPGLAARMELLYRNNQFWIFVGNKDYGVPEIGDTFPAVPPFQFLTQGASWSDQPFLRTAVSASAAFPRPTKEAILRRRLMAPTLQWLFRRTRRGVTSEADYLSAKAHPTVFNVKELDPVALLEKAHALHPEEIPPTVALALINSRTFPVRYPTPVQDYPDILPEGLFVTASGIGIILRAPEGERTFLFQARSAPEQDPHASFTWRVVHGDPSVVKITAPLGETFNTPERGFAQVVVDRRALTNRLDVACFAKTHGTEYGAPSIISFYPIPQEKRIYRPDGKIESIDYTNPDQVYCDPAIALPRRWKDTYNYTSDGTPLGFTRSFNGVAAADFTPTGERILEKNPDGTARRVVTVKYVPRQTGDRIQPLELSYADDGEPRNLK